VFVQKIQDVLKNIEDLREQLKNIAESKDLTDISVIDASQRLDDVLNDYYKLIKDKI
jgi:thymidylate kinase